MTDQLETFYRWWIRNWASKPLTERRSMLQQIKSFLTTSPTGKRVEHYIEIFVGTFGLAAIASAEHVADMHQPLTWSAVTGVAVAGLKAVADVAKPLAVAWFASLRA